MSNDIITKFDMLIDDMLRMSTMAGVEVTNFQVYSRIIADLKMAKYAMIGLGTPGDKPTWDTPFINRYFSTTPPQRDSAVEDDEQNYIG